MSEIEMKAYIKDMKGQIYDSGVCPVNERIYVYKSNKENQRVCNIDNHAVSREECSECSKTRCKELYDKAFRKEMGA